MTGPFPPISVSRAELMDTDGRDSAFRRMVYDLLTVGVRMQEARDRLAAEMGVTGPQYAILMAIAHMQDDADGAGVREVARRLHVSGPFITAQVNQLVDAELVEKHPNPADGRAVLLKVSANGEAIVQRTAPSIRFTNDGFFESLNEAGFTRLCDLAADLVRSSEAVMATPNSTDQTAVAKAG